MPHAAPPEQSDSNSAPASPKAAGSARRCLVTGASGPTANLIRFVVGPQQQLIPDLAEKLPGRGLWVSAVAKHLETALEKKLFARAARAPVQCSATLVADVRALLLARILSLLGLLRKAGDVVTGADAVRDAAGKGKLSYILIAADASAAGAATLTGRRDTPVLHLPVAAAALGAALGRESLVYLGLPLQAASATLCRELGRWAGLQDDPIGHNPGYNPGHNPSHGPRNSAAEPLNNIVNQSTGG